MPCQEWFAEQDDAYRESVLPAGVRARVSVEAGIAMSWHRLVGDAGRTVSLEHYGASAAYETLYEQFGITAEAVVAAARESIAAARGDAPGRQHARRTDAEQGRRPALTPADACSPRRLTPPPSRGELP